MMFAMGEAVMREPHKNTSFLPTLKQVRRVPVLDGDSRLVGIVSLGDLAIEIHNERLVSEALECISEPAMSH